jgi:hypothetical protein
MAHKKIARTKRETKRATEKPVDAEIRRAAERAGVAPKFIDPDSDPATQLSFLKDHLVRATDLVSETLASVEDQNSRDSFDSDGIRDNLSDVLLTLWRIRWECYTQAGQVGVKEQETGVRREI